MSAVADTMARLRAEANEVPLVPAPVPTVAVGWSLYEKAPADSDYWPRGGVVVFIDPSHNVADPESGELRDRYVLVRVGRQGLHWTSLCADEVASVDDGNRPNAHTIRGVPGRRPGAGGDEAQARRRQSPGAVEPRDPAHGRARRAWECGSVSGRGEVSPDRPTRIVIFRPVVRVELVLAPGVGAEEATTVAIASWSAALSGTDDAGEPAAAGWWAQDLHEVAQVVSVELQGAPGPPRAARTHRAATALPASCRTRLRRCRTMLVHQAPRFELDPNDGTRSALATHGGASCFASRCSGSGQVSLGVTTTAFARAGGLARRYVEYKERAA